MIIERSRLRFWKTIHHSHYITFCYIQLIFNDNNNITICRSLSWLKLIFKFYKWFVHYHMKFRNKNFTFHNIISILCILIISEQPIFHLVRSSIICKYKFFILLCKYQQLCIQYSVHTRSVLIKMYNLQLLNLIAPITVKGIIS